VNIVCDVVSQAVKAGGGADPVVNTLLAEAIREASAWGVPKDNIQRTIAKASHANSEDFKEAVFEVCIDALLLCRVPAIV
jgi:transcriptional/translational regulatory protein YebC/TACO1